MSQRGNTFLPYSPPDAALLGTSRQQFNGALFLVQYLGTRKTLLSGLTKLRLQRPNLADTQKIVCWLVLVCEEICSCYSSLEDSNKFQSLLNDGQQQSTHRMRSWGPGESSLFYTSLAHWHTGPQMAPSSPLPTQISSVFWYPRLD